MDLLIRLSLRLNNMNVLPLIQHHQLFTTERDAQAETLLSTYTTQLCFQTVYSLYSLPQSAFQEE